MTTEQFGHYRLDALIGRGGMGEVYRAFDTVTNRMVALKRLHPHLAVDTEFQARFRRESALVARLREPHIIPIHSFGEIDGRLYLDMRLVEGPDLATLIAEHGGLPPARAVHILIQIASAADAAHAEGLVHRDIKPSNVLLATASLNDYAYLVDFGIAHAIAATMLTSGGVAVGTLDYMAPERFVHADADHRVDVYSLTCLLYESLTGHRPFPGHGLPAQMYAHINLPPPRPTVHGFVTRNGASPMSHMTYVVRNQDDAVLANFEGGAWEDNPTLGQRLPIELRVYDSNPAATALKITINDFYVNNGDLILQGIPIPVRAR